MPAPGFIPLSDPGGTVPLSTGAAVSVDGHAGPTITLTATDVGADVAGAAATVQSRALAFSIALGG